MGISVAEQAVLSAEATLKSKRLTRVGQQYLVDEDARLRDVLKPIPAHPVRNLGRGRGRHLQVVLLGLEGAVLLLAAGAVAPAPSHAAPGGGTLTAGRVIDLIKTHVGVPWRAQTVDNIIVGSTDTPVTGIATVMMATYEALKRAAAAGRNLVITHEPTFFSHRDDIEPLRQDDVYLAKRQFAESHRMVVFHFHDHWHAMQPDGIAIGMARELGWEKHADPDNPKLFALPEVRLDALAAQMASRLGIQTLRVVGDPALRVRRVLTSWGYVGQPGGIQSFARPDIDVFVVGETWEWELVEYAQDAIAAGRKKALVILGHALSEQAGMKYCAEWLRGFVTEVPVEYLPLPEPYWTLRGK